MAHAHGSGVLDAELLKKKKVFSKKQITGFSFKFPMILALKGKQVLLLSLGSFQKCSWEEQVATKSQAVSSGAEGPGTLSKGLSRHVPRALAA